MLEWLPDDPYPRAAVELWPDEPGEPVDADAIGDIEDRMVALFERIAGARGAEHATPRTICSAAATR